MAGQISDQLRLLLMLAQGSLPAVGQAEIPSLLQSEAAWAGLIDVGRQQQVLPLVFRNLERLNFVGVPLAVRDELEQACRKNTIRNFGFARELTAILHALAAAAVPVIPLKGLPLAESLYGSIALRMCADIDLLIPRAFRPAALEVLSQAGYRPVIQRPFLQQLAFRHDIEYALVRQDESSRYTVELHWGLFTGGAMETEAMHDLWDAAIPSQFVGAPCWSLSPEWEVLFLSAHAARHEWQGLKWIVDVHEICKRGALDWVRVKELADHLHWTALVQITLSVAHALFETTLPAAFPDTRLPRWLQIVPPRQRSHGPGAVVLQLRLQNGPIQMLRFLARACLVPTVEEERWWRLPSALSWLYYPLRPTRLLLTVVKVGRIDAGERVAEP